MHYLHAGAFIVLLLFALAVTLTIAAVVSPRWRRRLPQLTALTAGGVLAAYLVARGIAEFFIVTYGDPASYRNDWGGPGLAGVFAVHSGPGLAVLIGAGTYLIRRHRRGHYAPGRDLEQGRGQEPGRDAVPSPQPRRNQPQQELR
jgi:hypothetical protein